MTQANNLLAQIKNIVPKQNNFIPPWNPPYCGEIDMRIAADGTWYYLGTPIGRKEMVKLFSKVLRKEDDNFFLVTPVEKVKIIVDDAPFLAISVQPIKMDNKNALVFTTQVDDEIILNLDNPIKVLVNADINTPQPYILARSKLWAKLSRPVYYELINIAEEKVIDSETHLGVNSLGDFFSLGTL